jgi:hypothetical protein
MVATSEATTFHRATLKDLSAAITKAICDLVNPSNGNDDKKIMRALIDVMDDCESRMVIIAEELGVHDCDLPHVETWGMAQDWESADYVAQEE